MGSVHRHRVFIETYAFPHLGRYRRPHNTSTRPSTARCCQASSLLRLSSVGVTWNSCKPSSKQHGRLKRSAKRPSQTCAGTVPLLMLQNSSRTWNEVRYRGKSCPKRIYFQLKSNFVWSVSEIYPQMFCLDTASPKFANGPLSVHCQPLQGNHTPLFIPKCGFHSGLNRSEEPI